MQNRLAQETSPYLLQHAHNPVDWYPWGPEALERAASEDKPILLSIGYAACHWCHVMERESFENPAVASQMNKDFVCIKVDREERPDLDEIYMAATVALSGAGGWPMTVFLTPEKLPFFAGTYFPPTDRYGRPGFTTLLERIAKLWSEDRQTLMRQAAQLTSAIRAQARAAAPGPVSAEAIDRAARALEQSFDPRWGGFGSAPKFPPSAALELLLRHHARTGDAKSLAMAKKTLDGMKNGGIYDHLGGGFARYSVDERWLVPHFEKMLYDNAELTKVYLAAYQVTRDEEYAEVARQTLDFVAREMQGEAGGYYSAYDADSEGEEGKFYVWRRDELDTILERDAAEQFAAFYDVSPNGNWEGANVLWRHRALRDVAADFGLTPQAMATSLATSRAKLYQARRERVPPLCDDKVLTAWNGLMIGAMAEGHRVLGEPRFLASAERAARFALATLVRPDGGLYRTARAGRAHLVAYLEDYAYLCDALVTLYEAGGDEEFLNRALVLAERMLQDFGDEGGALHHTARDHEALLTRTREGHDGAIPNANSVAARVLARLAVHFDRPELGERAVTALAFYGELVERSPRAFATLLNVTDFLLEGPTELVFAGDSPELSREVARHYLPNHVVAFARPGASERALLAGKGPALGRAALYVCRNFTCLQPVTRGADVAAALGADRESVTRKLVLEQARIAGRATAEGTARYAATFAARYPEGYRSLSGGGLTVSKLGFGCYRINGRHEHKAALSKALENGVNLIDTSTNYGDGRSERAVGSVLRELTGKRRLGRDELVVVSKIGYVQGTNLELASEHEKAGKPFPDMVKLDDELWHCISPEWLEDQLTRSLARLELETLDVCLLHNPEYFLQEGTLEGRATLSELRQEFYARLERAFGQLEREVQRGRIAAYGVSSNTAVLDHDHRDASDLSLMLEAARRAGGSQHHFQVLELPFNLVESGAYYARSAPSGESVLTLAQREGIAVLVNRPLNAMGEQGLERLAQPPKIERAPMFDFARNQVAALEREFRDTIAPSLRVAQGSMDVNELFAWSDHLADFPAKIESYEQWQEAEQLMVRPQVERVVEALDSADLGAVEQHWRSFRARYLASLEELLTALRARAAERSQARTARLARVLAPALPESIAALPLAQQALLIVSSVPGVTSVLVGARQRDYVDDLATVLQQRSLPEPERALAALKAR
ncbi:MAG TPA: aldo/keto reductase [Polyangiaceae bacterium]|nr:aldo/keto reductase [Polyangiaceae bacterium]